MVIGDAGSDQAGDFGRPPIWLLCFVPMSPVGALPDDGERQWPSIRERVEHAFDEQAAAAFGVQYLEILLTSWRELIASLRRTTLILVALVVAFMLLLNAKETQFTLGPLRLTNVAAVLTLIPPVVAALAYEFVSLLAAQALYRKVIAELVRVMHRSVYDNDLGLMLAPAITTPFGSVGQSWEHFRATSKGTARRILDWTTVLMLAAIIVGGLVFLVYAYEYLYGEKHTSIVAVSVSLAVTTLFTVRAGALMVDTTDQER